MDAEKAKMLAEAMFCSALKSGKFPRLDDVEIAPKEWELHLAIDAEGPSGALVNKETHQVVARYRPVGVTCSLPTTFVEA